MSYSREHGVSRPPARGSTVKSPSKETTEEAREKQARAVDLRRAGASFSEIAQALGYHDQSGAKKAVEAAIRRFEFEATKEMLHMDLARLDEYAKLATHRLRTAGDLNQIERLLRIMEKRHWLLGVTPATLAEANDQGDMKTPGGMNVVIASTERTFVRGMMQAVGMNPDSEEGRAYLRKQGLEEEPPTSPTPSGEGKSKGKKRLKKNLKKKLATKKPANAPSGDAHAHTPEQAGDTGSSHISEPVVGEVLSRDEAMRAEAKKISVRPTDADEVAQGVVVLNSRRI